MPVSRESRKRDKSITQRIVGNENTQVAGNFINHGIPESAEHSVSEIPSRIKKIRVNLGLNQIEMAAKIGVHPQTLSKYERNEQTPSAVTIYLMVEVLDVNPFWLLTGEGRMFGPGPQQATHSMNNELMSEVIERVEYLFKKEALYLPPKKKSKLIILLYEELVEDESKKAVLDKKIISIAKGLAA